MRTAATQRNAQTPGAADPSPLLQRKCGCGGSCDGCQRREEQKLQRSAAGRGGPSAIPSSVQRVIGSPGQPLPQPVRSRMEPLFGHDFGRVQLHTDTAASESVRDVRATAYTVGTHVAFDSGRYQPGTPMGDALLAHELAHVVQQDGQQPSVATKAESSSYSALEADADRSAISATRSLWGRAGATARAAFGDAVPRMRTAARLSLADCGCTPGPIGSSSSGQDAQTPDAAPQEAGQQDAGDQNQTPATPPPAAAPPPPTPSECELAGATNTKWRFSYKKASQAEAKRSMLRELHVKSDPVEADGKNWTFHYYPLTKAEAEAEKAKNEKKYPKYDIEVKESTEGKTWYLEILMKCPEGVPARAGWDIWAKCFATQKEADALVKKMKAAHIEAESVFVDSGRWGVYYKRMKTAADAKAAGDAAAAERGGFAEGMFKVSTSENKDLNSFAYSISTACPKGYKEVGRNFLITFYALAREEDFPDKDKVKNPCGLKGEFSSPFLFQTGKSPRGVITQGSGRAADGSIIHYKPKKDGSHCFEVVTAPPTASGTTATSGRTVAVDTSQIPFKTELLIEDVGTRTAEDTGGMIGTGHIDVYVGTDLTVQKASGKRMEGKKVCKKT
jgi:3D (Asp-Asp-Asp) domain-containing protein